MGKRGGKCGIHGGEDFFEERREGLDAGGHVAKGTWWIFRANTRSRTIYRELAIDDCYDENFFLQRRSLFLSVCLGECVPGCKSKGYVLVIFELAIFPSMFSLTLPLQVIIFM